VEVKSRRSWQFGNPKAAVTPRKQRKISMVALHYLKSTHRTNVSARFDVAAVTITHDKPQIEIIKNAFDLAYE
jgi:putative endonuclease